MDNIEIKYNLVDMTPALQESIKALVDVNVETKMDTYFKKVLSNPDAQILMDIIIKEDKKGLYEGAFVFMLDGQKVMYTNDKPFKDPVDLVNHAFQHLKVSIADDKKFN